MPEFNRNFAQGKINKDLDERLVPAGQYRDAMNIQVSTSDGSNVGSLENILGNVELSTNLIPEGGYCVGSIVDNEVNCIYYLVAGNEFTHAGGNRITKNYIVKYDIDENNFTFVFVDIYRVTTNIVSTNTVSAPVFATPAPAVQVSSSAGIRPGMKVSGYEIKNVVGNDLLHGVNNASIALGQQTIANTSVLGFNKFTDITAINIVEDLLMYTDDVSEPKTINIKRSILGTGSDDDILNTAGAGNSSEHHTRLVSKKIDGSFINDGLEIVKYFDQINIDVPVYSELENNTTIRKSPLTPPTLRMSSTNDDRPLPVATQFNPGVNIVNVGGGNTFNQNNPFVTPIGPFGAASVQFPTNVVGTGTIISNVTFDDDVSYFEGDFILMTSELSQDPTAFTDFDIRAQIFNTSILPSGQVSYDIQIMSISNDLENVGSFYVILEQEDALFEFKFPRFSYRYKYVDGQYSPFAPFSEVAFLPGPFDYYPKEGYNQGMANRLRSLYVENYAPLPSHRPKDITEIDVLYKEDKSTTVYTVKTIKLEDGAPLWPTSDPFSGYAVLADGSDFQERGSLRIESELIHAVVPANQLLRPWDNVPRKAKAQEVSANRLIYANYLQNYNLLDSSNKLISPEAGLKVKSLSYVDQSLAVEIPTKSIKTQRTYQLGVVYKDEFGRETPVLADKQGGSITVSKEFCANSNSFVTSINNNAPTWAKSFKFFIKETSNEYYNLAMDRWYNAEDGNLWISFPSSDRNKVDEETFLELKKEHDGPTPIVEPARYKILAIENEAPQDIKLDRKVQGTLLNGSTTTAGTTTLDDFFGQTGTGIGFPGQNEVFFYVRMNQFDTAFDTTSNNPVTAIASECSVRFRTITGLATQYYDIISIELGNFFGGGGNDGYRINLEERLGPEVNSVCGSSWANRNPGLQLQIVRNEYIDKPEFDGKFFVKVFKDTTLENFIMVLNDDNLVVVTAYGMRYLHTYDEQTGGSGGVLNTNNQGAGYGGGSFPFSIFGNTNNGYVRSIAGLNHVHPYNSSYTWGDNTNATLPIPGNLSEVSNQPNNDSPPYTYVNNQNAPLGDFFLASNGGDWGIYKGTAGSVDAGGAPQWWELLLLPIYLAAQAGFAAADFINDNRAFQFWNNYFTRGGQATLFIDDAWALSWAHDPHTIEDGLNPQDFEDWHTAPDQQITLAGGLNGALEIAPWNGSANGYQNGSRGIWGNRMDISVTGGFIGPDDEFGPTGDWKDDLTPARMDFMNPVHLRKGSNTDEYEFMRLLLLPGCKWKWQDDPDQTIHETVTSYSHWGITNAQKSDLHLGDSDYWESWNRRQKWTIVADRTIYNARRNANHDGSSTTNLQIMGPFDDGEGFSSENPAVWETKPKEDIGLDIYYEISRAYPIVIDETNAETAILPNFGSLIAIDNTSIQPSLVTAMRGEYAGGGFVEVEVQSAQAVASGDTLLFEDGYGGEVTLVATQASVGSTIRVNPRFHASWNSITLPWHNCYSFGNGIESDRIRDDFNQPTIQNGVKASTTIAEQYKEERRSQSFIFSGIFNSLSGVNRLNQFIQAEPITKDLDPDNGSIQKLFTRDTDIVTFCEDKVLKVLSDKDALFESGGNAQLTAANRVLGQAIAFAGDYGISTNPESFAADKYRCYFTDTQRGAVLRLSKDGMTPISDYGMKDYFTDTFNTIKNFRLIGTFDQRKDNYNLTMYEKPTQRKGYPNGFLASNFPATTVTYNEQVKGWTSFKSFHPETGVGVNNDYYTFDNGSIWKHHINNSRNTFYGSSFIPSYVEVLFNDAPSSVKNFQTIKYEGTQARINRHVDDDQYYNLNSKEGWYVEYANTDLQDGKVPEFLNKEGKWFNYIRGACTDFNNLDEKEFTVQGIGEATITHSNPGELAPQPVRAVVKDSSSSITGQNWD